MKWVRELLGRFSRLLMMPDSARLHSLFYDCGLWAVFTASIVLGYNVPFMIPVGHVAILFVWALSLDEEDRPGAKSRVELAGYLNTLIFVSYAVGKVIPGPVGDAMMLALVTSFVGWWGGQKLRPYGPDELEVQVTRLHESLEALNGSLMTVKVSLKDLQDSGALSALNGLGDLTADIKELSASVKSFDAAIEEASAMALDVHRQALERIRRLH